MKKILLGIGFKMLNSELLIYLLEIYVFPMMRRFVKGTTNTYDDRMLKLVENFLRDMAKEYDVIKAEKD